MAWLNIRQTDMPSLGAGATPNPTMLRVNTSMITKTQWLRNKMDSQRSMSILHRLSLACVMSVNHEGPSQPESSGR